MHLCINIKGYIVTKYFEIRLSLSWNSGNMKTSEVAISDFNQDFIVNKLCSKIVTEEKFYKGNPNGLAWGTTV